MNREYHRWYSRSLQREMELLVFGHAGARVLVFPTSSGRFFDWEDRGMVSALGEHLEQGWIQLFCLDSVDAESWYAESRHPRERALRHIEYERYILDEALPFGKAKNSNPYLITTGASFGAYHALNFGCRHPDVADRVIGMSGLYDIGQFTNGYSDENVFSNNPRQYLQLKPDAERLRLLRHLDIILAIGQDDPSRPSNDQISQALWNQGIWHALRIWDGWAHGWPRWQQMIRLYIGGHD